MYYQATNRIIIICSNSHRFSKIDIKSHKWLSLYPTLVAIGDSSFFDIRRINYKHISNLDQLCFKIVLPTNDLVKLNTKEK